MKSRGLAVHGLFSTIKHGTTRRIPMRTALIASLMLLSLAAKGQQYIQGYCKRDGTCVEGHFRTRPNSSALDNYASRGNLNPNTGQISSRDIAVPATSGVGADRQIHIGPRGGQYYIDENGSRVYVKK